MKKILFLILCTGVISVSLYGQSAFQDALQLRQLDYQVLNGKIIFTVKDSLRLAEICGKYVPNAEYYAQIELRFQNNPYIKLPSSSQLSSRGAMKTSGLSTFFTTASAFDVTNIADGMAKFVVQRTKEELNIYFFENFEKTLSDNQDLRLLFPATSEILAVAKDRIYDYQQYLPVLRESFYKDLREVLDNSSKWLRSDSKLLDALKADAKLYSIVKFSFDAAAIVSQGKHPGEMLVQMADSTYLGSISDNFQTGVKVASLLSQSLRSYGSETYWITKPQLRYFDDEIFLKIYLGLLYETIPESLAFSGNEASLKEGVASWGTKLFEVKARISQWTSLLVNIDEAAQSLKSDASDRYTGRATLQATSFISLILNDFQSLKPDPRIDFYARHTSEALAGIESGEWNTAIYQVYMILDSVFADHKELTGKFLKYGSFMASVVGAENSEEVRAAIEAVALPAGSSRIKRESISNISLNAYLGPYVGKENLPIDGKKNWKTTAGLAVPMGVVFSWGIKPRKPDRGGKSLSLFISAIDIGALASFRFQDDSTETVPEVQLGDIISPGAFVIFGFGKAPVSLSAGAQIGPRLHKVTAESADKISDSYVRWSIGLLVDIPMLNLYTKPRW